MANFQNFIGGRWQAPASGEYFENRNPADRSDLIGHFPASGVADVEAAVAGAQRGFELWKRTPAPARGDVLRRVGDLMAAKKEAIADLMTREMGKPLAETRGDVQEGIDTAYYAATEGRRLFGHTVPSELANKWAMSMRRSIGPCGLITPFNFPLNLAAHKIAPALAVGCPFVLKPASLTPIGALIIGEILAETNLPEGAFSILPCSRDGADLLTTDDRLKLLSFTGSPEVGWALKSKAGKKKVVLELGGNAAVIIDADTDIPAAVERVVFGAFYQSGQSCIGVQRIIIHEAIYDVFRDALVAATRKLVSGDPLDEATFIGPMISEKEAQPLELWIASAKAAGATVLCGGRRQGAILEATLLENVAADQSVVCEEAFGPVAVLSKFSSFGSALDSVNDSAFGLQAGIFTRDIHKAMQAWDQLEVGGVVIGDVPSWRVDHMPYGGVKDSGLGREGIRFAMEDMTEIRLLVIRDSR